MVRLLDLANRIVSTTSFSDCLRMHIAHVKTVKYTGLVSFGFFLDLFDNECWIS